MMTTKILIFCSDKPHGILHQKGQVVYFGITAFANLQYPLKSRLTPVLSQPLKFGEQENFPRFPQM